MPHTGANVPDEWRKHVDDDLGRLRQNQHDIRNEMNLMRLQAVEGFAVMSKDIDALKLSNLKEMTELKAEFVQGMNELKAICEKRDIGTGIWATIGSTIVAAVPTVCLFIWWLINRHQ